MKNFVGAIFGPIARNRFIKKFIVIRDGSIKKEVEERLLGLNVTALAENGSYGRCYGRRRAHVTLT